MIKRKYFIEDISEVGLKLTKYNGPISFLCAVKILRVQYLQNIIIYSVILNIEYSKI